MKIPIVLDIPISLETFADTIGAHIAGDRVVFGDCIYTREDFEENIREYISTVKYLEDPDGTWFLEKYLTDPDEQEILRQSLFDNFEPLEEA
jgi:hypothetical protein